MIKNFKRIFKILNITEIRTLFIILFLTLLATILEMISLGSIPIYVTFILEPDKLINLISKYNFFDFILQYSKEHIFRFDLYFRD